MVALTDIPRELEDFVSLRTAGEQTQRALVHLPESGARPAAWWRRLTMTLEILETLRADDSVLAAAVLDYATADSGEASALDDGFDPATLGLLNQLRELHRVAAAGSAQTESSAEGLRRLLLAVAGDVRAVLIRLCEQLGALRVLVNEADSEQRRATARLTMDVYAPLANRLGVWQLKWELEDLAFRILEPDTYRRIAALLDGSRRVRERFITRFVEELRNRLAEVGIQAEVAGRPKHIFSIWKKLERKRVAFEDLSDLRAVRVLVDDVATCYAALGQVHALWSPVPGEFDDYIATPKGNFYCSLHTAVIGPEGKVVEVQIRSHEMHRDAELGIAAHWRYKEGGRLDNDMNRRVALMRQLLEFGDQNANDSELLEAFRAESEQRVYVLTPAGDVVDLPVGATPLDFAYHIHTDVGHRCRGAKVNGRIVPLAQQLASGDQVEVLTTRDGEPARDWLNPHLGYLQSSRARAKVRQWFRHVDFDRNVAAGRELLDKELERLGLDSVDLKSMLSRFNMKRPEQLLAGIGAGDVTPVQVARLAEQARRPADIPQERVVRPRTPSRDLSAGVVIEGVGNLMTTLARCCRPVPNDPVVGYITRGRGVSVHRRDCRNMLRVSGSDRARLVEVEWGSSGAATYPVVIEVEAWDRKGLLRDISAVLADSGGNVTALDTRVDDSAGIARTNVTLEIEDIETLSRVLARLLSLPNVISARRA